MNELEGARRLYRAFREAPVRTIKRRNVHVPRAVARIGVLEFVGYMTTHRGKPALYIHHFAPGSRPAVYSGSGRNELVLVGGRYKVTERGITDMDSVGKNVDFTPRYVTVPRSEWQRMQNLTRRRKRT